MYTALLPVLARKSADPTFRHIRSMAKMSGQRNRSNRRALRSSGPAPVRDLEKVLQRWRINRLRASRRRKARKQGGSQGARAANSNIQVQDVDKPTDSSPGQHENSSDHLGNNGEARTPSESQQPVDVSPLAQTDPRSSGSEHGSLDKESKNDEVEQVICDEQITHEVTENDLENLAVDKDLGPTAEEEAAMDAAFQEQLNDDELIRELFGPR